MQTTEAMQIETNDAKTRANIARLCSTIAPRLLEIARFFFDDAIAIELLTELKHEDKKLVSNFIKLGNQAVTEYEQAEKIPHLQQETIEFTTFRFYLKFLVFFAENIQANLGINNKLALAALKMKITSIEDIYQLLNPDYVLGFADLCDFASKQVVMAEKDIGFLSFRTSYRFHTALHDFLKNYPQDRINKIKKSGLTSIRAIAEENKQLKTEKSDLQKKVGQLTTALGDAQDRVKLLEAEVAQLRLLTHQPSATASSNGPTAAQSSSTQPPALLVAASMSSALSNGSATPSKPPIANTLKLNGFVTERQQFVLEALVKRYKEIDNAENAEAKTIKTLVQQILNCAMVDYLKKDSYMAQIDGGISAKVKAFNTEDRTCDILKDKDYPVVNALLDTAGFDLLDDKQILNPKKKGIHGNSNVAHIFYSFCFQPLNFDEAILRTLPIVKLYNVWSLDKGNSGRIVEDLLQQLASLPAPQNHTAPKVAM